MKFPFFFFSFLFFLWLFLKESPVQKDQDDEAQAGKGTILLEQQLPVDADGGSTVLFAVVAQAAANLAHALEVVAAVEEVLDVLGHDLCDVAQLVVELVEVLGGAGVGVGGLCLCDEVVKLHEGVGAQGGVVDLLGRVGGGELGGQVGEVGEGELARVRGGADAEEDDVVGRRDEVVDRVRRAAVDAGLRLRVARELAEDLAHVLLDFGELRFRLLFVD